MGLPYGSPIILSLFSCCQIAADTVQCLPVVLHPQPAVIGVDSRPHKDLPGPDRSYHCSVRVGDAGELAQIDFNLRCHIFGNALKLCLQAVIRLLYRRPVGQIRGQIIRHRVIAFPVDQPLSLTPVL